MRRHSEPPIAASSAATPLARLAGDRTVAVLVTRRGSQTMNGLSGSVRRCNAHAIGTMSPSPHSTSVARWSRASASERRASSTLRSSDHPGIRARNGRSSSPASTRHAPCSRPTNAALRWNCSSLNFVEMFFMPHRRAWPARRRSDRPPTRPRATPPVQQRSGARGVLSVTRHRMTRVTGHLLQRARPADGRPGPAAPRRRSSMRSVARRGSRRPIGRTSGKDLPATHPRERPRGRPRRRSPPVPRVGGPRRGSERAPSAARRR